MTVSDEKLVGLIRQQYASTVNLDARIALHERFSVNRYGWWRWAFDQLRAGPRARVLEIGCGTGALWKANRDRIPAGWTCVLADQSDGMLRAAREALADLTHRFDFERFDARSIPHRDRSFDLVVANHMLYHVTDRPAALREIRRVLATSGTLHAATIGRNHMREVGEIIARFFPAVAIRGAAERFGLENGEEQLAPFFNDVSLRRYEDELAVTETEPLVAWILSLKELRRPEAQPVAALRAYVEAELMRQRVIRVTKDSGMFTAQALCA